MIKNAKASNEADDEADNGTATDARSESYDSRNTPELPQPCTGKGIVRFPQAAAHKIPVIPSCGIHCSQRALRSGLRRHLAVQSTMKRARINSYRGSPQFRSASIPEQKILFCLSGR